jgi:arginyl-tRNA synthetase
MALPTAHAFYNLKIFIFFFHFRKIISDGTKEEKRIDFNRLALCEVTADVMQRCFHILGIRPIDRM